MSMQFDELSSAYSHAEKKLSKKGRVRCYLGVPGGHALVITRDCTYNKQILERLN